MFRIVGTPTLLLALILPNASLTAKDSEERVVSIRVHDYAHLHDTALERAQEVVSGMYGAIGVRTDWLEPSQFSDGVFDNGAAPDEAPPDLVIVILTSAMANRADVPEPIMGYAASERGVGGRVAYVIYDRVRDFANDTALDEMRMMGIVMAHEIGHLLLAQRSHSPRGLMRERWDQSEFQSVHPDGLEFSMPQAADIRRAVGRGSVAPKAERAD